MVTVKAAGWPVMQIPQCCDCGVDMLLKDTIGPC